MIKTSVTLSKHQIVRVKNAYENKASVKLFLSYEKIKQPGKYTLLLTESQKTRLDKNKEAKRGIILDLTYEQLKTNYTGGFLPILFAALGPIAALAAGSAAIANAVKTSQHQSAEEAEIKRHNIEMEKIAQSKKNLSLGSGLKKKKIKSCR